MANDKKHKIDSRRTPVGQFATISFGGKKLPCLVLNISGGGAGLVLQSDVLLPAIFDLEMRGDHTRRRCVTVWRADRRLGVSFDLTTSLGDGCTLTPSWKDRLAYSD
jgi:hypothetical protein